MLKKLSNISLKDVIIPKHTAILPLTSQAVSRTAPHREEATLSKASTTTENAGNDDSKFAPLSREINEVTMETVSMSMASLCFS
jgi:hypothetical protein